MNTKTFLSSVLMYSTIASTAVHAGAVIEMAHKEDGDNHVERFSGEGERFRMEGTGEGVIYKDNTMYMIDDKDKTYRVMDEAAIKRMQQRFGDMKAKMDQAMAKMSPEQRAQMEAMMKNMGKGNIPGMPKQQSVIELRPTGRNDRIAGIACHVVEEYNDKVKTDEYCVAKPADVPGVVAMMEAMKRFGERMQDLLKGMGVNADHSQNPFVSEFKRLDGIPIRTLTFDRSGKVDSETVLTSAKQASVPASVFEVPAGYKRKEIDFGKGDSDDE